MAIFQDQEPYPEEKYEEDDDEIYDDGFDQLSEEEEPEETEEERTERKQRSFRVAFGAGNLVAVIGGTVLILVLLTLLFNMIYYVTTDMSRNFSLFQTKF